MAEPSATARFEAALAALGDQRFVLRLFVAGASPGSQRAIANLQALCARHLAGRYELEVVDIYQQPELAAEQHIVAVPALLRLLPEPVVRIVGDLSDHALVLTGLDLEAVE